MIRRNHGLAREAVPGAFDTAAGSYDRLVGANPGYHQHLRRSARHLATTAGGDGLRLLDAGCGTGASTAALLAVAPRAEIVAFDASAGMLEQARAKSWPANVRFVHTPVEELERAGVSGPFDGILAAYLVRNVVDPDAQLRHLRGLLAADAPLIVHEYSVRDSALARLVWHAVCWGVIIPAGAVTTRRTDLYRHLWRSVTEFDGSQAFAHRLRRAGFTEIERHAMTGWQRNIVHTFVAIAPPGPGPT